MRQNQKGFSLVELIVLMAVMAVLGTVGLLSFSLVTGQHVRGCAKDMESYIGQTRVQAMTRAMAELEIFVQDDGVYVNLSVEGSDVKIGRSGISVRYLTSAGGDITLSDTQRLTLSFDRSSGAFRPIGVVGTDEVYCTAIIIEGSGRTSRITLVPRTGKYYIEE